MVFIRPVFSYQYDFSAKNLSVIVKPIINFTVAGFQTLLAKKETDWFECRQLNTDYCRLLF